MRTKTEIKNLARRLSLNVAPYDWFSRWRYDAARQGYAPARVHP